MNGDSEDVAAKRNLICSVSTSYRRFPAPFVHLTLSPPRVVSTTLRLHSSPNRR